MARAKTSEPSRVRAKTSTIDELTRGARELQEFLAQVEDLGREGFPYLDAARARTELQIRECIRRTFGEKSPEFQEHRHRRLLIDSPGETRQSIALIKTLIATIEQKKIDLQGRPSRQQISATVPAQSMPKPPPMTVVPASISTVQTTVPHPAPITPQPVAMAVRMTSSLDRSPASVMANPPPPPLVPSATSRQPEPVSPATSLPEPISIAPAPSAMLCTPPQPVAQTALEHKPPPSAHVAQTAQSDSSHAGRPPQPPRPESEPNMYPISSASIESKMQDPPLVPPHLQPHPSMPIGAPSHQEPAPQSPQPGSNPVELVRALCCRFHSVARQLRLRGEYRATLSVEDEIDVQDLLHALLRIQFDDIGTEEWAPSYAEGALRTTFLLNDNRLAVLVKKTRNGLNAKDLTEQLRIDTERYRTKSRCTSLLCFIYDPDGRIGNPRDLEASLTTVSDSLAIHVLVAPK